MSGHRTGAPLFQVLEHGSLGCLEDPFHLHHHHVKDPKDEHHLRHNKGKGESPDGEHPAVAATPAAHPAEAAAAHSITVTNRTSAVESAEVGIELPGMPAKLGPAGSPPLNLLANLPGEWHGKGFTITFLPVFFPPHTQPRPTSVDRFRLMVNDTQEILEFTPIPGAIPNRGDTQKDVDIFGMTYMQRIIDSVSQEALHKEPGIWLVVPPTTVPHAPATVVRQGCVPHGNSFHAVGSVKSYAGPPKIPNIDITPIVVPALGVPILSDISKLQPSYMVPIHKVRDENPTMPVMNPNEGLIKVLKNQNIIETVEIHVSTKNPGLHPIHQQTITNIPFLQKHAEAVRLESTFYLETVRRPNGSTFLQLQYTQTVFLRFQELDWPHISIATLIKT